MLIQLLISLLYFFVIAKVIIIALNTFIIVKNYIAELLILDLIIK